jgi:hypothetical protein
MSDDAAPALSNKPSPLIAKGILPQECRMLVMGDSHARFWSGQDGIDLADTIPEISTYHLGAALAYNTRPGAKSGWLERVTGFLDLVSQKSHLPEFLMFSFGEIDIRVHIVRRALAQGLPLSAAVDVVADNYLQFLDHLRSYDRQLVVWGPPPSQSDGRGHNPNVPVFGPEIERNAATALFHARIAEAAADPARRISLVSVLREMLLPNNVSRRNYYYDDNHLSQAAMPHAMAALEKATGWRPRWAPVTNDPVIPPETSQPPRSVNIAPSAMWRMHGRNMNAEANPVAADALARKPVRSPAQNDPLLLVDLRTTRTVQEIRLGFPTEEEAANFDGIRLMISTDTKLFEPFAGETPEAAGCVRTYRFASADFRAFRVLRPGSNVVLEITSIEVIALGYVAPV